MIDYKASESEETPRHIFMEEGVHRVTAWFIFNDGTQISQSIYIVVNSKTTDNDLFGAIWNEFKSSIISDDQAKAMSYISDDSKGLYQPILTLLSPEIEAIFSNLATPKRVSVGLRNANYISARIENGENKLYFINFLKKDNGIWVINSL